MAIEENHQADNVISVSLRELRAEMMSLNLPRQLHPIVAAAAFDRDRLN